VIDAHRSFVAFLVEVLVKIAGELDEGISEMSLGERGRFEQKVRRLTNCEYLSGEEIDEELDAGIDVVSATFVTPYPPGFPVLVPGVVFSRQILTFMRDLDTPEIHGYKPEYGYRVYTEKAIESCRPAQTPWTNGHGALPTETAETWS
jgi:arginine decarboxylase